MVVNDIPMLPISLPNVYSRLIFVSILPVKIRQDKEALVSSHMRGFAVIELIVNQDHGMQ